MERIGIAASKIAKGNLFLYNFFVILISFLFSLLIFLISGLAVVIALAAMDCLLNDLMPAGFQKQWTSIVFLCMALLATIVGVFNLLAISKNVRFSKNK